MKKNYQIAGTAVAAFLLMGALFTSPASAQHNNRGGNKHEGKREQVGRQKTSRDQDPSSMDRRGNRSNNDNRVSQSRDWAANQGNNNHNNRREDINRQGNSGRNEGRINNDRNTNIDRRQGNDNTRRDNNITGNRRPGNDNYGSRRGNDNNISRNGYGRHNNHYASYNRPAYRPVYTYHRAPVYSAYNPGWRYGWLPRRNSYYHSLPSTYISINFGGFGYRYWDGVFYRPYNNLFTVIAPPVGIYINVLPVGYRRVLVRNYPYYYYNGTYYDQRGSNYYVVSPPLGAVVESLPEGYETVVIDGETYYSVDGAQYKPVVLEDGEIWYEVIKAN